MPFHVVKSKIVFSLFADSQSTVVPGSTPDGEIFFCWFGPLFIFLYPTMPPCRAAGLWLWTCKPELEAHTCGPDGRQAWTGSLNGLFLWPDFQRPAYCTVPSIPHIHLRTQAGTWSTSLVNSTCQINPPRALSHTQTSCENQNRFLTASGITLRHSWLSNDSKSQFLKDIWLMKILIIKVSELKLQFAMQWLKFLHISILFLSAPSCYNVPNVGPDLV